ncbi:MAG TPA: hypothetical protein VGM90_27350 [Kofleriaceae bacterium]
MRLVGLLVCLLTACGFSVSGAQADDTPGSDAGNDAGDAGHDGSDSMVTSTCMERWMAHTIRFTAPTAMTTINSMSFDRDPFITTDEKSLLLSSGRPLTGGGLPAGGADIFISTRANVTDPWPAPQRFAPFSTTSYDGKCSMALDDSVVFVTNGLSTEEDIYTANLVAGSWTSLTEQYLVSVDTFAHDFDAFISADALRLYWAPADTGVPQHIAVAKRATATDSFGAPSPIAELNAGPADGDPTLTPDQRLLLFYSRRVISGQSVGAADIWYATRDAVDSTFTYVGIVPDINSTDDDGDPHISADGCHIWFGRHEPTTDWDLYEAAATP